MIGDLAGFIAATYLRGINLVQVPTTLLAMVDSSVGGKTGINLSDFKNQVGAFHQPRLVIADLDTLRTLPSRQFAAGVAEVIKYAAIKSKPLFKRVVRGVKPNDSDLASIVQHCVKIKAEIVQKDEYETKGKRAVLNFGHTIGHAIEKAVFERTRTRRADPASSLPPFRYNHGQAVALGMRAAAWMSYKLHKCDENVVFQIEEALRVNDLPIVLEKEAPRAMILSALQKDKKRGEDGEVRWVLLNEIGNATTNCFVNIELVNEALDYISSNPK